jgi:hypothetical protein
MRILLAFVAAVALVLGWGWWHAMSHATLRVSVHDVALASDNLRYGQPRSAELAFLDANGQALADGSIGPPWGLFAARHPQAGDCRREQAAAIADAAAASAWHRCFDAQSTWLPQWAPRTRYATVKLGTCTIQRVPVEFNVDAGDWWLWWVPLPHVGGTPYASYEFVLWIDSGRCQAASATSTA